MGPAEYSQLQQFPSIHYAIFLAQNVNILATSPCTRAREERLPCPAMVGVRVDLEAGSTTTASVSTFDHPVGFVRAA